MAYRKSKAKRGEGGRGNLLNREGGWTRKPEMDSKSRCAVQERRKKGAVTRPLALKIIFVYKVAIYLRRKKPEGPTKERGSLSELLGFSRPAPEKFRNSADEAWPTISISCFKGEFYFPIGAFEKEEVA